MMRGYRLEAEKVTLLQVSECVEFFLEDNYHYLLGGFKLPKFLYERLYDYQRVGVSWMWNLHQYGIS